MADLKAVEAARELSVHVNTIKRMLHRGELDGAYQVSTRGDWRIPRQVLEDYRRRKRPNGKAS